MVHNVGFREQLKRMDGEARNCRALAIEARKQGDRAQMNFLNLRAESIENEVGSLRREVDRRRKKRRHK